MWCFLMGTKEEHTTRINMVRYPPKNLANMFRLLADTKVQKLRTGKFENGGVDKKGDIVKIYLRIF